MNSANYITNLYKIVDAKNPAAVTDLMTEDSTFCFSNIPAVSGKENINGFLANFYQSIKRLKHDQLETWFVDNTHFAIGRVTYTRLDDSTLSVPFSVVLKMDGELIKDYLIFMDASELFGN